MNHIQAFLKELSRIQSSLKYVYLSEPAYYLLQASSNTQMNSLGIPSGNSESEFPPQRKKYQYLD